MTNDKNMHEDHEGQCLTLHLKMDFVFHGRTLR